MEQYLKQTVIFSGTAVSRNVLHVLNTVDTISGFAVVRNGVVTASKQRPSIASSDAHPLEAWEIVLLKL